MSKKSKAEPAATTQPVLEPTQEVLKPTQPELKIVDGPMATGYNSARSRKLEAIKWIVIHYTGCNGSAHTLARSFARPGRKASTHYFVDDREVRSVLPWHRVAWHIGDGRPHAGYSGPRNFNGFLHATRLQLERLGCTNNSSISVDICAKNVDGEWVLDGVDNVAALVRMLMDQLDIDVDHVVTHRDCTGKPCPQPWAADPSLFDDFKKSLKR